MRLCFSCFSVQKESDEIDVSDIIFKALSDADAMTAENNNNQKRSEDFEKLKNDIANMLTSFMQSMHANNDADTSSCGVDSNKTIRMSIDMLESENIALKQQNEQLREKFAMVLTGNYSEHR